ncbi:hypothetical protein T484DRAFT_1758372 [Baffinella frigidus]|nr:hypothetical protein T484DRAFT_1758372 [Cryptophyta sp. CCMP2293]
MPPVSLPPPVRRGSSVYPPMEDDEEDAPVRQRVHVASGLRMGPPIDLQMPSDGLSVQTRKRMHDYIAGTNVLGLLKRVKITHEDDPEAVAWARETELERNQHKVVDAMRSEILKGFEDRVPDFDFTRNERCYIDKLLKFTHSLRDTTASLSDTVYEKACRGVRMLNRRNDDLYTYDRKLERRDDRAEKLQNDKVSGVEIVRELHTKLVDSKTALGTATAKSEKQAKTLNGVMLMVERGRCTVCMGKILNGWVMVCKNPICVECEARNTCPCKNAPFSNYSCEPAYPVMVNDYMQDTLWVMELMDRSSIDGVDAASDIENAVKNYIDEKFVERSAAHLHPV